MSLKRKVERIINAFQGTSVKGVMHYNWFCDSDWLVRFALHYFDKETVQKKLAFISVFGPHFVFRLHKDKKKVFFTGENVNRYRHFKDLGLPFVDLSMSFEHLNNHNYLRFPLWIMYLFAPEDDEQTIREKVKKINAFHPEKTDFASLIARNESPQGLRKEIMDALNTIAPVKAAGRLYHNDDRLWQVYDNKKIEYLKQFRFSICPENSNAPGYVTEKLFEAFLAGTIPIYWGDNNQPELQSVNQNAVIFWTPKGDNSKALSLIRQLQENPKLYDEFVHQARLNDACADYVIERFYLLRQHLKKMLEEV